MFQEKKALKLLYCLLISILIFIFIFLLVKLFPFYGAVFSFLWKLFAPFIISCLIAYLLYPIIEKLRDHNINRTFAILFIYIIFFGGTIYLVYHVYPNAIAQLQDFSEHLPQLFTMYEEIINNLYVSTSFLPEVVHDKMDIFFTRMETSIEQVVERFVGGFTKIYELIVILTVIPVLVFYFLKDYNKIKTYIKKFIPIKYQQVSSELFHAIDHSLGSYIRGQLLISLSVSLMTWVIFQFLGMKYTILLAIIMGITNFIPYFGPIIGAVPAVAIALTISSKLVVFVLIAVLGVQLIENNLISPFIMGKSINIHPIAIIFALLLGGQLKGILGMLLAVPLLTILKDIITHIYRLRSVRRIY